MLEETRARRGRRAGELVEVAMDEDDDDEEEERPV